MKFASLLDRIRNVPRYIKNRVNYLTSSTVLIHIGKCGGSTVVRELERSDLSFYQVHIRPARYVKGKEYFIALRNLVSRFISAFNWRYKLVVLDQVQKDRFDGEYDLLKKFGDVNRLAEALYNNNGDLLIDLSNKDNYIHHLYEDIQFYLKDFLNDCPAENIGGVICTESLAEDMKRLFNIDVTRHDKKNKSMSTQLSPLAKENLNRYLKPEFDIIDKLNDMGVLTGEQYSILTFRA